MLTPVAAQARVVERVAAVVGDALVLASEVEDRVGPLMADVNRITDPDKRSARATALRREVLERLIDDELIYQQAAELKLTISSDQVDASIEEIKKQNNLTDEQLREALRGQGMTMASYRADLRRQLLRFRVLNIAVGSRVNISDDEVRAYYERHMKDGSNVQVRASHVYVAIPEGADAASPPRSRPRRKISWSGRRPARTSPSWPARRRTTRRRAPTAATSATSARTCCPRPSRSWSSR